MRKMIMAAFVLVLVISATIWLSKEKNRDDKPLVGLSMHFMQDDYAKFLTQAFSKTMEDAGIDYEILDAEGNPQKQLNDVENLLAKGIDVLVICPMDEKAVTGIVNEATDSGVSVVAITHMPGVKVASTISGGDFQNGYLAAQALVKALGGKGKIALLDVTFEIDRVQQRVKGFWDALEGTDIEVVAKQKVLSKDSALTAAEDILTAHQDLNGFFCSFGNPVFGAGTALKQLGRKDVAVTGVDADFDIMNLIKEGYVTAAAAQFPESHGRLSGEVAVELIHGKKPASSFNVPHKIVDKSNVVEMSQTLWRKKLQE